MNLEKLFKMQKELDERILDRFPELRNEYLLDKKILALQVELGELAQNWRGFKFWSENQEPNGEELCGECNGNGYVINQYDLNEMDCPECKGTSYENPLLEEYVDCLHFILSIGNELEIVNKENAHQTLFNIKKTIGDTTNVFNDLFTNINDFRVNIFLDNKKGIDAEYHSVFHRFYTLGNRLGFTWEQIEQAYFDKNKVNHERQEQGY